MRPIPANAHTVALCGGTVTLSTADTEDGMDLYTMITGRGIARVRLHYDWRTVRFRDPADLKRQVKEMAIRHRIPGPVFQYCPNCTSWNDSGKSKCHLCGYPL